MPTVSSAAHRVPPAVEPALPSEAAGLLGRPACGWLALADCYVAAAKAELVTQSHEWLRLARMRRWADRPARAEGGHS